MFEIDWKKAPKNARWWAVDRNGESHIATQMCQEYWERAKRTMRVQA